MSEQNEQGVFGGVNLENNNVANPFDGNNSYNVNNPYNGINQFNGTNNYNEATSYFENGCQGNANNGTENKNDFIFGNVQNSVWGNPNNNFQPIAKEKAITEKGLWSRIKEFLFQEIDLFAPVTVELTPYQQKVEDEINEFLHQEITFKGITNLFKKKK